MSTEYAQDIRAMHDKFDMENGLKRDANFLQFRLDFVDEEHEEMHQAIIQNRPEDFVDACIDQIVVLIGLLDLFGVRIDSAWNEVHRANISKERGNNPKRERSFGFDLVKPDGWVAPTHLANLGFLESPIKELSDRINNKIFQATHGDDIEVKDKTIEREAIRVFEECVTLIQRKSEDYNSDVSSVQPADYFPFGIDSFYQMILTKVFRIKSVIDKARNSESTNFESLEDSLKDNAVYSSMAVEWLRKKTKGQNLENDMFNKIK